MSGTKAEKGEEIMGHYTSEGHIVHLDNTAPVEGTRESPRKMLPEQKTARKRALFIFRGSLLLINSIPVVEHGREIKIQAS